MVRLANFYRDNECHQSARDHRRHSQKPGVPGFYAVLVTWDRVGFPGFRAKERD
jgi:hypothetical protein